MARFWAACRTLLDSARPIVLLPAHILELLMFTYRSLLCLVVLAVILCGGGCAQPEKRVEKKKTIRVRAPYTSVDVEIPEDKNEDVNVDVHVRP
ncbi:MAG: hypothetical protein AABZ08_03125 [Planctomycetota bacterium]